MSECPNASEPNFALTQCDFQFHYNLWVIRAHQDIRQFRRALSAGGENLLLSLLMLKRQEFLATQPDTIFSTIGKLRIVKEASRGIELLESVFHKS